MKYFSSFSTLKTLPMTFNVLFIRNLAKDFSNSTCTEKYKTVQYKHIARIFRVYGKSMISFWSFVVSISESVLGF